MLSFVLYVLLIFPFKKLLFLLGLGFLFPVISGFYACLFTTVSLLFNDYIGNIILYVIFMTHCISFKGPVFYYTKSHSFALFKAIKRQLPLLLIICLN